MGNTGLRPDESAQLQDRDVTIIKDEGSGQRSLEIEGCGNCGVGYCKGMPGAALPYERVHKCKQLKPTDYLFGNTTRDLINTIPEE
ncbi:hypothetical protein HNR00_004840 [Methylorubrum rhodinum]|uniref:Uncharacterized protein n=1 Tax=Methylorubrum rhodinum TaxID=29428 RepID=A0A840ZTE0_9HYPH|nr:hypothetical protein [Methylorubrum rhodinum]MBB5760097.1 hypothetical protein [Methylorubrum rhodinum]